MNQPYFIVVLAHSLHGRIRRFHIDQKLIMAVLALAVLGSFTLFGFVSSYIRMAFKVANYNSLRQETEFLRVRYQKLLNEANQTTDQLAKLQMFASEVSVAYGIRRNPETATRLSEVSSAKLVPTYRESLQEYNVLRSAGLSGPTRNFARRWFTEVVPSLWPVQGRLSSYFGQRSDPFMGESAFHSGVDIAVSSGTSVMCAADGIVREAGYESGYGKLIVIDHGEGVQSYYGHLSRIDVIPGMDVRRGQVIGASGATGRATAPHLHYEVRRNGLALNPYHYLSKSALTLIKPGRDFGF